MNKKAALVLITVVLVLVLGGLFLKSRSSKGSGTTASPAPTNNSIALPENQEKDIVVSLTPRGDKKAVILKLSKIPADLVSVEYEFSYDTKAGLPRGVLGKIDIKNTNDISREILLGTCSTGGKCVFDEGVTKVSLQIKFNKQSFPSDKSSGQSTGFSQDYEL